MAMTAAVKDELSRVDVAKPCCRRSEMAALLRFAGGLHIVSGRVVVEAELDTGATARRLRRGGRAQGEPLHRSGGQGRRGAGPPDRPPRRAWPAGAWAAAARRLR